MRFIRSTFAAAGAFVVVAFFATSLPAQQRSSTTPLADRYRTETTRLLAAALSDSSAYNRLARLTDTFGSRLSDSASLEAAIDWILAEMKRDGLDNVRGEKAMVPHWVRGEESAMLVSPRPYRLHMVGLGRSVGTPARGITAEVLAVGSFDEFAKRQAEAKGKIVLFDEPFVSYGETVRYRGAAASTAARAGAVAALISKCRVQLDAEPAYRGDVLRHGSCAHSSSGAERRGRDDAAPHERPR